MDAFVATGGVEGCISCNVSAKRFKAEEVKAAAEMHGDSKKYNFAMTGCDARWHKQFSTERVFFFSLARTYARLLY